MIGGFLASCALKAPGICLLKIGGQVEACLSAAASNHDWVGLAVALTHHPRPHCNETLPPKACSQMVTMVYTSMDVLEIGILRVDLAVAGHCFGS